MITRREAIDLLESDDLVEIGMAAHGVRERLHPYRIVSYGLESEADDEAFALFFQAAETPEQCVGRLDELRGSIAQSAATIAIRPHVSGTAVEYLKILAVTRLYLEEIPHVQTSWSAGLKVCQIALRFGANDIAGAENERHRPTEEQLRRLIRDAGFVPKQRDALFRVYSID